MNLFDLLNITRFAEKRVEGPTAGKYQVSKANLSAGYYIQFVADVYVSGPSNSHYYLKDQLFDIAATIGLDGWKAC
jgi:hypothetical protein